MAPTLRVVAVATFLLSLPSASAVISTWGTYSVDFVERSLSLLFGVLGLVAFLLASRARVREGAWAMLAGLLMIWLLMMPVTGLERQAGALVLMVLPLMLAGMLLGRMALWGTLLLLIIALGEGAIADGATASQLLQLEQVQDVSFLSAAGNLSLFTLLVDGFGVRLRQALRDEADKSKALAETNTALIAEQAQRQLLERERALGQRLESMGRLAASVAHDFNNLLTGMIGNASLVAELSDDEETRESMAVILDLGERASSLTQNLLRFSRGGSLDKQRVDIHDMLHGSQRIYSALIKHDIELQFKLEASRATVACNPGEFEQLVLNLVVNAADAMPMGGILGVGTRDVAIEGGSGCDIELYVSDTGTGMTDSTRVNIFRPFFTTKGERGTGIGLATVHEVVTKAGGEISVDSQLQRGTTFRIRLPLASER